MVRTAMKLSTINVSGIIVGGILRISSPLFKEVKSIQTKGRSMNREPIIRTAWIKAIEALNGFLRVLLDVIANHLKLDQYYYQNKGQ